MRVLAFTLALAFVLALAAAHGAHGQVTADDVCPLVVVEGASVGVHGTDFSVGAGGRSASCHVFPTNVSFTPTYACAAHLGGGVHYMPDPDGPPQDLVDLQATEDAVAEAFAILEAASYAFSEDCYWNFLAFTCLKVYPSCVDDGAGSFTPVKFESSVSDYMNSFEGCAVVVFGSESISGLKVINGKNEIISSGSPQYFYRPLDWLGTPTFEAPGISFEDMEAQYTLPGKAALLASEDLFSCEAPQLLVTGRAGPGIVSCEFPCELPLYSAQSWLGMWAAFVVPGLLSIPLLVLALWRQVRALRAATRRSINWLSVLTISVALAYVGVAVLPAAALKNELGCSSFGVGTTFEDKSLCNLSKVGPYVLQSFILCVVATLYNVYVRTRAAKLIRLYEASRSEQLAVWTLCFVVPGSLCALAFALENLDKIEPSDKSINVFQYQYLVRNSFTCTHRFENVNIEIMLVHVPLLLAGVVGLGLALAIALRLREMTSSASLCSLLLGRSSLNASAFDLESAATGKPHIRGAASRGATDMTARMITLMLRFAFVMFIGIVIGFMAGLSIFPAFEAWTAKVFLWADCTATQGLFSCFNSFAASSDLDIRRTCCSRCSQVGFAQNNTGTICTDCSLAPTTEQLFGAGQADFDIPSGFSLALMGFSHSILPFAFGILFAWSEIATIHKLTMRRVRARNNPSVGPPNSKTLARSTSFQGTRDTNNSFVRTATSVDVQDVAPSPVAAVPLGT